MSDFKIRFKKIKYTICLKFERIKHKITAAQMVTISFLAVIFLGSFLLYLPASQNMTASPVSYINALFTAVSATCVTGLVTVVTAVQWNLFGQIVILLMIQIGGLSFITLFTFVVVNIGKKINLKNRMLIQASLNQNDSHGMVKMVLLAIKGTLLAEGIGAFFLYVSFVNMPGISPLLALRYSIFHAISAFCNAGFDIIGTQSFASFSTFPMLNITIMSLITIGGIGFTVWREVLEKARFRFSNSKKKKHFSIHTKLAFITSAVLILSGATYFFITEYNNPGTLGPLSVPAKILASFFQSVTLRTAGFFTIDQNALTESSKFVSSLFMMVGGSPGGTAGGIKTVTLAVVIVAIWATLRGRKNIETMKRSISIRVLTRAITIIGIMFSLWFIVATALEFTEAGSSFPYTFVDLLFEVASALGTVGLTTGITPYLSSYGKILIMMCMFIGRLGPIGIAVSLQRRLHTADDSIVLPEDNVIIG